MARANSHGACRAVRPCCERGDQVLTVSAEAKDLLTRIAKTEGKVRFWRGQFGDDPVANSKIKPLAKIPALIKRCGDVYFAQTTTVRKEIRDWYWQALCAFKLFLDDVAVETLLADPSLTNADRVRLTYLQGIEEFIRGNPFLYRSDKDRTKPLFSTPSKRSIGMADFLENVETGVLDVDPGGLTGDVSKKSILQDALDAASKVATRLASKTGTIGADFHFDDAELANVGTLFLLLQMVLGALDTIGPPTFPGRGWYASAARPVRQMRENVLGIQAKLARDALLANDLERARLLRAASNFDITRLARTFSLRIIQTVAAWAFRDRHVASASSPFGGSRLVVGANNHREKIFSFLGRGNPDGDRPIDVIDVDEALKSQPGAIKVAGVPHATASRLDSLISTSSLDLVVDRTLLNSARSTNHAVIASGTLDTPRGKPTLRITRMESFGQGYATPVGFPIRVDPTQKDLDFRPFWRTETKTQERAAAEEELLTDKLPPTLVGQGRLVHDLLANDDVRKSLGKAATSFDHAALHDHAKRAAIWKTLFGNLHASDPNTSVDRFVDFLRRFHEHMTRHTFWNVRDEGKKYFESTWPHTIASRALWDCGVYAVVSAHDIFHALDGSGAAVRFGFLTVLNHIALVVYHKGRSFLINNDVIYGPTAIPKDGEKDDNARAQHALRNWARRAFSDVYNVTYGVALARVPTETVTNALDETKFETRLFDMYLRFANWWGLQPGIAGVFHELVRRFNADMIDLDRRLARLSTSSKADSKDMLDATSIAVTLYATAEQLASASNYALSPKMKGTIDSEDSIGVMHPSTTLPLYRFVALLANRKKQGDTLTADQDALLLRPTTPATHADALNKVP